MRNALVIAVVAALAAAVYLVWPEGVPDPERIEGAEIHLPFDGDLNGRGRLGVTASPGPGIASFVSHDGGRALWLDGDGAEVVADVPEALRVFDRTDISFAFRAERWKNPYPGGSSVQTMVVLTSRALDGLHHATFRITGPDLNVVEVRFETADGQKTTLRSSFGAVTYDWQRVSLRADATRAETSLLLDGVEVARGAGLPRLLDDGLIRVKFGTWHRQNQAFRGAIDRFVIRDGAGVEAAQR